MPALLFAILNGLSHLAHVLLLAALLEIAAGDYPWWLGIGLALLLLITDFAKNQSLMQCWTKGGMAFYTIRTALISMVFDKMMRLSPAAQTNTATGVILNYITVDVVHSRHFWSELQNFIYCPLVLTIGLVGLSIMVGVHNMIYGMVILIGFQFIGLVLSRYSSRFTDKQMEHKDERLKLINDLLNGVRVIKLCGWEAPMQRMVAAIRKRELKEVWKSQAIDTICETFVETAPLLATLSTFYAFVVVDGNHLNPRSAFVTLFLFDQLRFATYKLPRMVMDAVKTIVSLKRVLKFLLAEERSDRCLQPPAGSDDFAVRMVDASFSWTNSPTNRHLSGVTVEIPAGKLVGVIGAVGSGKSTLLSAIAGELEAVDGECSVRAHSMAYTPQSAWIQNMTLKDNVQFDSPFDVDRYERTIEACCLRDDIDLLPAGDRTEIGEKGINLSGGQKARVSLARAVYRSASFYVLDDPLSAVDSHVGRQIFDRVIGPNSCLKDATRIVALNLTHFLNEFDLIISLRNGNMMFFGPPSELKDASSTSLALLSPPSSTALTAKPNDQVGTPKQQPEKQRLDEVEYEEDVLVEAEAHRAGRVLAGMYVDYIREFGVSLFLLFMFLLLVCSTVSRMFAGLYMAHWSSQEGYNVTRTEALHNLEIYGLFCIMADLFFVAAFAIVGFGSYRASASFHSNLLISVLRAPMQFFERTPLGRIMNRFSMDIELLDTTVCASYGYVFIVVAETVRLLLNIFASMPLLIPVLIPLIVLFFFMTRFFNAATVQFRRIASKQFSHVCSAVQDAYAGASSIRVYGCLERFREDFGRKLNRTVESNTVELVANMWVQARLDAADELVIFVFIVAAIFFESRGWITMGVLGLVANSSIAICGVFGEIAMNYRDAETEIVCVERVKEYTNLEPEGIWKHPPKATPADSSVEFRDVSLRYREQDGAVLHKVSFRVEAGEKVGIVGRTGAGKTSISSVLFRLVDPFEGAIEIGGTNINDLGRKLREILTIIPQDPILFCGTLRSNLDPFEEYTDEQVWSALERAHLAPFVRSLADRLQHEVADSGSNLRQADGRQLVCLARALLRTTSILVLDEATAAVDLETDALVQKTIREHFAECTVLTIAHRLHTIMDYDKVLVMAAGRVCEFDTPANLLAREDGLFREFAQMAGIC
ncbi:Multidrug resistance-associated protein 1 isoform X4 [Aphelenchoides fujianensis]|nr:Multidrug resistance-associated protein 1 isoform X4 [Aphelenchoides fujianensis]